MWYDLLTLVILMYSMFRGAMKGIVWQLATIAALLLCFFFAGSGSMALAPFIRVEEPLNRWIAMFALYLIFSFISFGAARVLHEMIESMKIEALDRHLGAILGLVKGGMFSIFLTFFLVTLSHAARETIINSESGYVAAVVIDRLDPVVPGNIHALLEPYLERFDPEGIERQHRDERYARDGERGSFDRDDPRDDRSRPFDDRDRDRRDDVARRDPDGFGRRDPDGRRDLGERGDLGKRRDLNERHDRDGRPDVALDRDRDGRPARLDRTERRRDADPFGDLDADRGSRAGDRDRDRARGDDRAPFDQAGPDLDRPTSEESDWLSSLPGTLTEELKRLALKAWRNTKPQHRREFTRRMSSTGPELIQKTLRDWENGAPSSVADGGRERADLERQIVRALADSGAERRSTIDEIETSLQGIPDDVAVNVLRDWRADLLDQKSDPDPSTTGTSSLNDRIRRQLSRAGISLRTLDAATRDRLRDSQTR